MKGMASWMSTRRITIESVRPPKYPATSPSAVPECRADKPGNQNDHQRDARALDDARQQVAPDRIRAERVEDAGGGATGWLEGGEQRADQWILMPEPGPGQGQQKDGEQQRPAEHTIGCGDGTAEAQRVSRILEDRDARIRAAGEIDIFPLGVERILLVKGEYRHVFHRQILDLAEDRGMRLGVDGLAALVEQLVEGREMHGGIWLTAAEDRVERGIGIERLGRTPGEHVDRRLLPGRELLRIDRPVRHFETGLDPDRAEFLRDHLADIGAVEIACRHLHADGETIRIAGLGQQRFRFRRVEGLDRLRLVAEIERAGLGAGEAGIASSGSAPRSCCGRLRARGLAHPYVIERLSAVFSPR